MAIIVASRNDGIEADNLNVSRIDYEPEEHAWANHSFVEVSLPLRKVNSMSSISSAVSNHSS